MASSRRMVIGCASYVFHDGYVSREAMVWARKVAVQCSNSRYASQGYSLMADTTVTEAGKTSPNDTNDSVRT